ncbi:hypothetical protein GCM10022419_029940 [Nonomuraea rosea]|uniref:Regulator of SigK n=2 Tax=Nonomuraea rosea TaxID=638574 RepID=A0ABP6W7E3_9ACTN
MNKAPRPSDMPERPKYMREPPLTWGVEMNDELHTLSGAYAVHALPYAEWVLFEEHLVACSRCGNEVRHLRETAARLAEAVAEPPPAALRRRLLDAAHRSRAPEERPGEEPWQHSGRPEQGPEQGFDDSPTIWRPPVTRILGTAHLDAFPDAPTLGLPPEDVREVREFAAPPWRPPVPHEGGEVVPLRRGRSRVLAGLSAVAAAAAIALGVVAFDARRDLGDANARNDELIAVLAAPDAETMRQPVTSGGTGTVVISRAAGRMVFASSGLPELPASRAYELWLMGPGGTRPAGMIGPAEDGLTGPMLLTPLSDDDHVALTVEPAAGSERPTTPPVMLAALPSA